MYKKYQKRADQARPDVKVPPSKISKFVIFIVSILSKVYLYMLFGFARIFLHGDDILFDAFKRALSNKSRCIIAFRHPDGREPQLLLWFFMLRLKKYAAKKKIKFDRAPHSIFVYGYEVARWGGWVARFFMPNLGAIPIHHTKMDSKGMAKIYSSITDGPYPLALAPEGQVSYTVDSIPRLEPGVVRIGFHAAGILANKNDNCPIEILPISFHLFYDKWGKAAMEKLLFKIEKYCGFKRKETFSLSFSERLDNCRKYILELNEKRYAINIDNKIPFEERLEKVVNAALTAAENSMGIKAEGDFFSRLYKVRHDCWDRIFLPDYENLKKVSIIDRNVMDLRAGEAWHASRHQELADFGWYFRHPLPTDETPLHQKVEYVQNLWDFANRTMGGALSGRVNIPPKKIIIKTAAAINLSERLTQYKEERKKTIDDVMSQLEEAYLGCIKEVNEYFLELG